MREYIPALALVALVIHQWLTARFDKRQQWHYERREYDEARKSLTWMIWLNPFNAHAYFQRALIYIEQKDWQRALKNLSAAIRWKSTYREAYERRAQVYQALGETEQASADTKRVEEFDLVSSPSTADEKDMPRHAEYLNRQIERLTKQIEDAEARRAARLGNTPSPDKRLASLYKERADFFRRLKDQQSYANDIGKLVEYDPQNAAGYAVRGAYSGKAGDDESAIRDLTEAIRLKPKPHYYYVRAYSHYRLGNDDAALADCESAIRLDSKNAAYYELQGSAYFRKGEYEKCLEAERKAFQTTKQDSSSYRGNIADAHFALGNYAEALREYTLADESYPDVIRYIAGIALTHYALGNLTEAHKLWHKVIRKDEGYANAEYVAERYEGMKPHLEAARALIASLEPPADGT